MTQSTDRTELILMFEKKMHFGILFGIEIKKTKLRLEFESATTQFGRFCKEGTTKSSGTRSEFFPEIGTNLAWFPT